MACARTVESRPARGEIDGHIWLPLHSSLLLPFALLTAPIAVTLGRRRVSGCEVRCVAAG
jgi:hypothetical protein